LRFERLIEEAAHNWFKKIGEFAHESFSDPRVKGVIIGGPGPTKLSFLNADYLTDPVKKKVIGTIDTGYTDEFGIREMMQKGGEIFHGLDVIKEKDLVNRFLKEATVGKLATYGEQEVRDALLKGQVAILLVSESVVTKRVKHTCPQCGNTVEKTIKGDVKNEKCPKCGADTQTEEKDVLEELAALAESTGTTVEVISTDTPEGEQFVNGFGGIGAILRYR
jgi:peptide chain release factor subunit 1